MYIKTEDNDQGGFEYINSDYISVFSITKDKKDEEKYYLYAECKDYKYLIKIYDSLEDSEYGLGCIIFLIHDKKREFYE